MNIAKLNDIFTARGAVAALATATAAQMDDWIIQRLRDGTWEPGKKSDARPAEKQAAKPVLAEVRTVVDRNGDKRIVKTTLGSDTLGYSVETLGESGDVVSREGLGKLSLTEARTLIGKSISHPVPQNAGKKTNDPANMCPKGASTGGGNKKGK